jgi:hypothetical protein
MQSKMPGFCVSRGQGFRERDAVHYLQDMLVRLHDNTQGMVDTILG